MKPPAHYASTHPTAEAAVAAALADARRHFYTLLLAAAVRHASLPQAPAPKP